MRKREAKPGSNVYHRPTGRWLGVINRVSADGVLLHLEGTDQGIATIYETTIGPSPSHNAGHAGDSDITEPS